MVLSVQDFAGGIVQGLDPASEILKGLNAREQIQNKPLRQQQLQQNFDIGQQNQQINQIKIQQAQQQQAKAQQQQAVRQQMTKQLEANARIRPVFNQILKESDPIRQNAQLSKLHSDLIARGEEEAANEIAPWLNITDQDVLKSTLQGGVNQIDLDSDFAEALGDLPKGAGGRRAGAGGPEKFSAVTKFLEDGSSLRSGTRGSLEVFNAAQQQVFGEEAEAVIDAATQEGIDVVGKKANIRATAQLRAKNISEQKIKFRDQLQTARLAKSELDEMATLIEQSPGGVTDAIRLQAARVFPNMVGDVTSIAQLDTAFTRRAVQELDNLRGAHSDFELNEMKKITGKISDSKVANRARVASIDRLRWIREQESLQFNELERTGGDIADFQGLDLQKQIQFANGASLPIWRVRREAAKAGVNMEEAIRRLGGGG